MKDGSKACMQGGAQDKVLKFTFFTFTFIYLAKSKWTLGKMVSSL